MTSGRAKSSLLSLAFAFSIGQGSVFALGSWLVYKQYIDTAVKFQVYVSIFSFCQQFADIGSTSRVLQLLHRGEISAIQSFLYGKSILAAILSVVAGLIIILVSDVDASLPFALGSLAVGGALFGLATYGNMEKQGNFWRIASIQVIPWLMVVIAFLIESHINTYPIGLDYYFALIPLSALIVFSMSKSKSLLSSGVGISSRLPHFRDVGGALPYIGGQIAGQLWGRAVLLILITSLSPVLFASLGPMRQVHIGLILLFGMVARSVVRASSGVNDIKKLFSIPTLRIVLIGSLLVSALSVLAGFLFSEKSHEFGAFVYWGPIFLSVFPVVYTQICQFQLHAIGKAGRIGKVEFVAFLSNVATFLSLHSVAPNWALGLSESAPASIWSYAKRRMR